MVGDLKRFVATKYQLEDPIDERLDSFVSAVGGTRTKMVDPWAMVGSLLRLRRPRSTPDSDVYEIPIAAI